MDTKQTLLHIVFRILVTISILFVVQKFYFSYKSHGLTTGRIANEDSNIVIYSKNACMYCLKTQNILDKKQIKYQTIDLSNNPNLHMELLQQTGQTTVPYIFINDNFIGGFQDLKNLEQQEKL